MRHSNKQAGFTIVEMLFSMTILSVVLVLLMATFVQISRMYQRGTIQTKTQELSRTVIDEISRPIQFSGTKPDLSKVSTATSLGGVNTYAFCMGSKRYSFVKDLQLREANDIANKQIMHVLWRDTLKDTVSTCSPLNLTVATPSDADTDPAIPGRELLTPYVRIAELTVAQLNNPIEEQALFRVLLVLAYGDNNTLTGAGANMQCQSSGFLSSQFCATSYLDTAVLRRIR